MKFLSLFAGIGGFDLGLERAGMQCVGQVEKDKYCLAVLAHHWPNVKRVEDIHNVNAADFGAVDLICGGFPCQPFSLAGKRAGQADDRYLWPEMLRVIKAYRPAWVLGENVAGIVGVELDKVLADLETEGYELQPFIIPACAVDAPHERKRVWIVAYSKHDERNGTQTEPIRAEQSARPGCGAGRNEVMANAEERENNGRKRGELAETQSSGKGFDTTTISCSEDVADSPLMRMEGIGESRLCKSSGLVAEIISDWSREGSRAAEWEPEPDVGRLADGIPNRVAQLRALGNAVVPQVVEVIGRAIMETERAHPCAKGK